MYRIAGVLLVLAGCCVLLKGQDKTEFVKVRDTKFYIGEEPYFYVGMNYWQGAYLGAEIIEGGKERLIRELDFLKQKGINNLRIMASSEKSDLQLSVTPAFHISPGQYNEELLQGLDFLLDEMAKRDMKAVLVLNNYWQWSGGMAQYVSWTDGSPIIDPDVTDDWHNFMRYSANFYEKPAAQKLYYDFVEEVIQRTNTINNTEYKNDPTIMSWQLANEPRPHFDGLNQPQRLPYYYQWIDSAAKFIHKLDPNHLVTTGNEGLAGSLYDSAIYINTHAFTSIDYMTFHLWPKNWVWFDAHNAGVTLPKTLANTKKYFEKHMEFAEYLNKPIVLEEYGISRDMEKYQANTPSAARDTFFKFVFDLVEAGIISGRPIAGTNIWAWGGEGRAHNPEALWLEGIDFTGDPPQEPQGLNSIFDTDSSTLEVITNHYENLMEIMNKRYSTLK
ncbi:MAG: cellulase family glycosylhydrolase [Bacteroidales bacterium]|nr:cellulase family glycosylhydrolase [Bacteroidales bacterium]